MGEKTMESKAKTKNGIKRVVFSGIAILLEIIFLLNIFMRLNYYTQILNWTTHIVAILLVLGLYASHQTASMKMPWIILIMSAPILGVTLYLLIGLNGHTRKMKSVTDLLVKRCIDICRIILKYQSSLVKKIQKRPVYQNIYGEMLIILYMLIQMLHILMMLLRD